MKRSVLPFILLFLFFGSIQAAGFNWLPEKGTDTTLLSKRYAEDGTILPLTTTTVTCGTLTLVITGTDPLCNGDANGSASVVVSGGTSPYTYLWTPTNSTTSSITGLVGNTYLIEVWDNTGINYCSGSIALVNPPSLIVNITPPAPVASCFGVCDGSATASPSGGTSPYTYSWNTVPVQTTALATGLCAQTYSVTVTDDHGCVKVKQVIIGQPALLVSNGSSTSITCFGSCNGTASTNPSGGNPPYTYSWAPGGATTSAIAALCPNTYTCTVTDTKSCVATYVTTIAQPPVLTVTVTSSNVLCNGACTGSVTATASGGVGNYTYNWAPGGCSTSACTGLCVGNYTLTLTDGNGCMLTSTVSITQPPAFTVSPTGTNISCFGSCNGTASANPAGGTSPYTYAWAPAGCTTSSCTGLCVGTYTLNATDAGGCVATGTVTISQPAVLAITPSSTDVSCNGSCNGSMTASVSGGVTPYTYAWTSGCTTSACINLCPGNYSVTVTDANGCTATASVTIGSPAVLVPALSSTNASCFGLCDGSVLSSASGGTAPYTYSWSNGCTTSACTNLCAGNYTLTLTDANGCPASGTVSVTQPAAFTATVSSATPNPLNCNGDCDGTAVASVNGGTPLYTYLWTTGATTASVTGLCAGVYSVTVTDANGCPTTASVTFVQPSTLTVTITSSDPTCGTVCDGSISAVVGGATPPYTFSWQPGGQTASAIAGQCAGTYTLTTTDNKGCSNTQTVTLSAPNTLIANTSVLNHVSCAGNCDGSATSSPVGGTAPFTYAWTGGQTTSTATGLCAGTFSVTVTDANGCTDVDVLIITQPSALTSNISSTTSSCTLCNGTATVSTSGGTAPYTFLWSDGQTTSAAIGLCATNYTVDVTDANGCMNTVTVTISPVVTLTITVSGTSVSCPGACDGIANATPFGGAAPYTYAWSTAPVQTSASATGLCAGSYTVNVSDSNGCLSTNTLTFTDPAPLVAGMSSTTASCGICNGTATVAPSGGTGGYTYSWSGFPIQTTATATGLCSGDYTVTLTDANNCAITNTVSVGNVPAISDNASTTLSACSGSDGAICVSPSGGTPAYTYLWAPGGETTACITGLPAGIYSVTISDAAGCVSTFQNTISNAGAPAIAVNSQTDPICAFSCNGSIDITASLGVPNYTYLWSPGGQTTTAVTGLCAGTYIIQVIDAQPCTSFASITLTDPVQLSANPTITNVSCSGGNDGNICLAPSGGTGAYTYNWLPGGQTTSCLSALTAGTYSVVVTDAIGCDDTLAIPVTAPATLSVTISSNNVTCNGNNDGTATATVTGGTTLYTYAWSTGGLLPSIVGLAPGNYSITVTDSQGCTATASVTITEPAALTTTVSSTNITCNALCDGTALITASGGTLAYTYSWNTTPAQSTASITGLCAGNFVGTVTDLNGCVSTKSVTITQPTVISPTVTSTNASCFGGCNGTSSVSVSGGTGAYTYAWNPGGQTTTSVTGLCAGSYTLDITDANGCGNTQLISITAPTVLQANITNVSPSCTSTCDGTATSSPVGGTGAYTYSWSTVPVQTTATATGLCAGTYTLTLSDGNGCFITQTTNIIAPAALTQANGVADATCLLCNGTITIIASGGTAPYSYFWSTGATTATVTGLCAGVYVDTVMDSKGCISVDTIGLSNSTGPTIVVNGTNVLCFGACNGTATVSSATGDGPPWVYSWFPFNQTTQSITGLCPLQYFATVTDTNGCKTVDNINIVEPAQLASNPAITNVTCIGFCNGSVVTNATGGTGAYTYAWAPGGQTTSSITGQCAGTYTLTLTDANNCVFTTTVTIGQNTILTSTLTSTNDSCNLSCDGTATVAISGGTLAYTYLWAPTGLTTTAVTGLCAGTHTVTTTDAAGCQNISTVVITEPAALSPGFTAVNPTCNGVCDGSLSSTATGGTPPYTYVWTPGGATTTSITGLCAGNYSLTITDANNCVSTTTTTLTAPAALTSTSTVTNASCNNLCNGSVDITPAGGTLPYTFMWSPGGQTTEDITGLCPGIDSVLITDANGCTLTYSVVVGAITIVIADGGNDTSFCTGGTATLTSNSVNAISIGWYEITTPSWTFLGSTTTISQSPPVGVTNYALIATNGICSDTDTVVVTVNAYPILVTPNDTSICLGDSVTLCVNGAAVYQWYAMPAWTPVTTGSCITVTPALGTTSYGIIGFNGTCSDTDSVAVTVLAMPTAIAGNDTSNCFGDSLLLCGTNSLNAVSYAWYTLPAWALVDTTVCVTVVPPSGIIDYVLIASNGICSDTDTVSVNIFPSIGVDAGTSVTILSSASTQLNGTGNGTYVWTPATGLSSTTIANPTANPTITTTYTLTVTDTSGCVSWDTVRVTIINKVVPNDGLSPNGDGINDIWEIPSIESFPGALVEVYNRWGELLFSTTDYINNKWNAKYKGSDLPVGTYYYVINLNSDLQKDPITGPITILR